MLWGGQNWDGKLRSRLFLLEHSNKLLFHTLNHNLDL